MQVIHEKARIKLMVRDSDGEVLQATVSAKATLRAVTTIAEVAHCWGLNKKTVERAINDGRIIAEKSGSVWLIATASVVKVYGKPKVQLGDLRDE